jgi:hypothetical protein
MKVFVVVSAFLVVATAAPSALLQPLVYAAPHQIIAAPAAVYNQHHAQDEFGQYTYGYSGGPSAKIESKSLDGVTRGSYSYVDANGKLQTVSYTADDIHGFRVTATNIPEGPVDNGIAPVDDGQAPEPVTDTPEVVQARAEHLAAVQEAIARNAAAEKEDAAAEDEEKVAEEEKPAEEPAKIEAPAAVISLKAAPIVAAHPAHFIPHTHIPSSFAYTTTRVDYDPIEIHAPAYGYRFIQPHFYHI